MPDSSQDSSPFDFNPDAIGHVLADRRLTVPIYQRSYSWDEEQIADFWSDISGAQASGDTQYFLGTIVLSKEGEDDGFTIIDGQQRLATTLILLAAIRNEFKSRDDVEGAKFVQDNYVSVLNLRTREKRPRLRMNSDDDPYFRALIIDGEESCNVEVLDSSHDLIRKALQYFENKINGVAEVASAGWEERLTQWVEFLEASVRIIVVDVATEADAYLIFETLNDRGADLTIADLLKNYLFGRAGDQLETVRNAWMTALGTLDMSAENSVFTTFLRHLWSSKHGATREKELYRSMKERIISQTHAVEFSRELRSSARHYAAILNSDHEFWSEMGTGTRTNLETLIRVKTTEALLSELTGIVPTDAEFETSFSKARVTKNSLARYYLAALQKTEHREAEPELVPNQDEEQVNLEHILPRNPRAGDWSQFSTDEQKTWVIRLGNMALLQKGPNDRIGNRSWSDKKPILADSDLSLTSQASQENDWTKSAIDARQQRLAALAVETWHREP